jgi:DNA-binding protein H-NS
MRKLKSKTYESIAKYYHTKGKSADHSTILYRTNMFEEIKKRKPEYETWLNIIKNEIISSEELLTVFDKLKVLKTSESLEQVNELVDKLTYKEKLYNTLIHKT